MDEQTKNTHEMTDWHGDCNVTSIEGTKNKKTMIDLKELAWDEWGREAHEAELEIRERMEREYGPLWEAVVRSLEEEQKQKGGENE